MVLLPGWLVDLRHVDFATVIIYSLFAFRCDFEKTDEDEFCLSRLLHHRPACHLPARPGVKVAAALQRVSASV